MKKALIIMLILVSGCVGQLPETTTTTEAPTTTITTTTTIVATVDTKYDDCEALTGVQKDRCYYDKALVEGDVSYCDEIENVETKEICKTKVG